MASTDPEISAEGAMPQWMKVKVNASTTFEAPFAPQSPPAYEDSFFYIRYPNTSSLLGLKTKEPTIVNKEPLQGKEVEAASSITARDFKDWSKHTEPCREVVTSYPNIRTTAAASITSKPKSAGIDDGFKGEGAACGSSILKVAQQMIAGQKVSQRGYTEANIDLPNASADGSSGGDRNEVNFGQYNVNTRRGSKSLPASPSSSPTSRRKAKNMSGNRYFAGTYEVPPDIASSRSWIMAALLGQKRDMPYSSTTTINEEEEEHRLAVSESKTLAASVDNLGPKPTVQPKDDKLTSPSTSQEGSTLSSRTHKFRAKPTELREINFWSPTSM